LISYQILSVVAYLKITFLYFQGGAKENHEHWRWIPIRYHTKSDEAKVPTTSSCVKYCGQFPQLHATDPPSPVSLP